MKYQSNAERIIYEALRKSSKNREKRHKRSKRISPSKIAKPAQQAVLEILGVKPDEIDDRIYGIFARGEAVETAVLGSFRSCIPSAGTQIKHEYRYGVGYADLEAEGITYEIKSVNRKKFEIIQRTRQPQLSHALQLCFYLAAKDAAVGRLLYVCAEDYATVEIPIYRERYIRELDHRIDRIHSAIGAGVLPDFEALEPFHRYKQYLTYSGYYNLKGEEAEAKLKEENPEAYELLKSKELWKQWQN